MKEKLPYKLALRSGVTVDVERVQYYIGFGAYRVNYRRPDGLKGCLAIAGDDIFEETDYAELRTLKPTPKDRANAT